MSGLANSAKRQCWTASPLGGDTFALDRQRQEQWRAFLARNRLEALGLKPLVAVVREFALRRNL